MPNKLIPEIRLYGASKAFTRFIERRHLRLVAYLVLAAFAIAGFAQERAYSNTRRQHDAQLTYNVLVQSCEKNNNGLRKVMRSILEGSQRQIRRAEKAHSAPADQIAEAKRVLRKDLNLVRPVNCKATLRPITQTRN